MAQGGTTPDTEHIDLSDADTDDLFASPSRAESKASKAINIENGRVMKDNSSENTEAAREDVLRRELAGVRSINEVIESVVDSLERAKGNMEVGVLLNMFRVGV